MSQPKPQDHILYHESVQFAKDGQFSEALQAIEKAIELDQNHAPSYRLKARILNALGQKQQAIEQIEKSISLQPNYAPSYDNKGLFLIQQNKLEEAENCFRISIQLDEKFSLPQTHLGDVYKLQGKSEQATQQYQLALSMDPNDALALCGLAKFAEAMNILEDSTRNQKYPKPHREYIDYCLQQIDILKKQAENIQQFAQDLSSTVPKDFDEYLVQVQDFEKTFYIDVSPEKQSFTKQKFAFYIQQSKSFKYEILSKKIEGLQSSQRNFIISYYFTLRKYFDKQINVGQDEKIIKEIKVEEDLFNLCNSILDDIYKIDPIAKLHLSSDNFQKFLKEQDLQLEISLSSFPLLEYIAQIISQNQDLTLKIKQIQIYEDQFGQYGFEQAINILIQLGQKSDPIEIDFNKYLSEIVINNIKKQGTSLKEEENLKKVSEIAPKTKKTACCIVF